jgi:hypothetical protein
MLVCIDENVKGTIHLTFKIKIFLSLTVWNYNKYITSLAPLSKEIQKHWLSLELGNHNVAIFYSRLTRLEVITV